MPEKDAKLATLRQLGTLNPRPREVTDPLFATDSFFDPRDLVQVKYEMLRRVQSEGHSVTGAATAFGFPGPRSIKRCRPSRRVGLAVWCPTNAAPSRRTS